MAPTPPPDAFVSLQQPETLVYAPLIGLHAVAQFFDRREYLPKLQASAVGRSRYRKDASPSVPNSRKSTACSHLLLRRWKMSLLLSITHFTCRQDAVLAAASHRTSSAPAICKWARYFARHSTVLTSASHCCCRVTSLQNRCPHSNSTSMATIMLTASSRQMRKRSRPAALATRNGAHLL